MANYTVIYGNVIYTLADVKYMPSETHRIFLSDGKLVFSLPISSVLIQNNSGVTAKIVPDLNSGASTENSININTANSNDNFKRHIIGGEAGGLLSF